jgi:hypothetical protein
MCYQWSYWVKISCIQILDQELKKFFLDQLQSDFLIKDFMFSYKSWSVDLPSCF